AVRRHASGPHAHRDGLRQLKRPQINHANRIALAIGDVGILAVSGPIVRQRFLAEIPPRARSQQRNQNNDEEESSQSAACFRKEERLAERSSDRIAEPVSETTTSPTHALRSAAGCGA